MAKDKKKKKKDKQDGKSAKGAGGTTTQRLKAIADNPMIADVVAAALVGMASALKDSNKARQIASQTGEELGKLSKAGAERGNALWDMALQIGRESLKALGAEDAPKRAKSRPSGAKASAKKQPAKRADR